MTDIRFYHLQNKTVAQAMPDLITKILSAQSRIVVRTQNDSDAQALSAHLWTADPESFLPHGTVKDGHAAWQPVYITGMDDNPNNADVLITQPGVDTALLSSIPVACLMFDGRDGAAVETARGQWKSFKDGGHTVSYYQQREGGGWEKQA